MTNTEQLILLLIRQMTESRHWIIPCAIHYYLLTVSVNAHDDYDSGLAITEAAIDALVLTGHIRHAVTHEYDQQWPCLRLTPIGEEAITGLQLPEFLRDQFKPFSLR